MEKLLVESYLAPNFPHTVLFRPSSTGLYFVADILLASLSGDIYHATVCVSISAISPNVGQQAQFSTMVPH